MAAGSTGGRHGVITVLVAALLAAAAGLFASVDAALSSFSRARAEELHDDGRAGAERLAHVLDDPARYLNTVFLLKVLCETAAIVLATFVVVDHVDGWWTRLAVVVPLMVVVSYVLIGVGPRTLGRQRAEGIALASAWPVSVLTGLLGPIPWLLIHVGNAVTPGRGFAEGPFASEVEVRELVDLAAASAVIESDESRMIQQVFELGDTLVREVMVPRTDLVFIDQSKTLRQAMSLALRSGYSRLPVIDDTLDDVVGMAYLKDVTKRVFDKHAAEQTEKVDSIMRPVLFVPDTKPADTLLREMQAHRTHVAIVVDEYGGTAGLVTIEDILEEIVGEIADEYDTGPDEVEELGPDQWEVSARFQIDDLADLADVRFDDEDVDSVLGLLAKHLGKVPIAGSQVQVDGVHLVAVKPQGRRNRVTRVRVSRVAPESDSAGESVPSSHERGSVVES